MTFALGSISPALTQTSDDPRFAYTRIFTQSSIFYGYCVGDDCTPTKEFSAFQQAGRDEIDVVLHLLDVFERATPAGRLYIAKSIQRHDPERAGPLFLKLKQDQQKIGLLAGCMFVSETVASIADELERHSFEDGLPDRPY